MRLHTATPGQQLYLSRRLTRLRLGLNSVQHPCPPGPRLLPCRSHTQAAATSTATLDTAQIGAEGQRLRRGRERGARPGAAQRSLIRPEVLAPAGGWPQLRAAVENGADAVYFGLTAFSARARASNFAPEELPEVPRLVPSAAWHA